MAAIGRWGNSLDLDFWTATEAGQVDAPEVRAVDLLRRTTDAERYYYYCQTGMLPAMGNMTRRIYLILRGGSALELEDGQVVGSWCISIGPHAHYIPGTDQVVVLRNLLEGEEMEFMRIGNRTPVRESRDQEMFYSVMNLPDWLPDIFRESLLEERHDKENEEMLALEELRAEDWYDRDVGGPIVFAHPYLGRRNPVGGMARALFYHDGYVQAAGQMDAAQAEERHEEDLVDDGVDVDDEAEEAGPETPQVVQTLGGGQYVQWPGGDAEYFAPVPQGPYYPVQYLNGPHAGQYVV